MIILPSMIMMSMFMEPIVSFITGVKYPLNASHTSTGALSETFLAFCSTLLTACPSQLPNFSGHSSFRLVSDNDSSAQLLLRQHSAI